MRGTPLGSVPGGGSTTDKYDALIYDSDARSGSPNLHDEHEQPATTTTSTSTSTPISAIRVESIMADSQRKDDQPLAGGSAPSGFGGAHSGQQQHPQQQQQRRPYLPTRGHSFPVPYTTYSPPPPVSAPQFHPTHYAYAHAPIPPIPQRQYSGMVPYAMNHTPYHYAFSPYDMSQPPQPNSPQSHSHSPHPPQFYSSAPSQFSYPAHFSQPQLPSHSVPPPPHPTHVPTQYGAYPHQHQGYVTAPPLPSEDTNQAGGTWWYLPPPTNSSFEQPQYHGPYTMSYPPSLPPPLEPPPAPRQQSPRFARPPSSSALHGTPSTALHLGHTPIPNSPLRPTPVLPTPSSEPRPTESRHQLQPPASEPRPQPPPLPDATQQPQSSRKSYHPNPPAHRSEFVMWVGNVPQDATHDELWRFFNQSPIAFQQSMVGSPFQSLLGAPQQQTQRSPIASSSSASSAPSPGPPPIAPPDIWGGVSSVFLISRSNCAFVNFDSEVHLQAAVARFNGQPLRPTADPTASSSRFFGDSGGAREAARNRDARLVCRVRRKDDDLKSGVGAQRGMGVHTRWVKEKKDQAATTAAAGATPGSTVTPARPRHRRRGGQDDTGEDADIEGDGEVEFGAPEDPPTTPSTHLAASSSQSSLSSPIPAPSSPSDDERSRLARIQRLGLASGRVRGGAAGVGLAGFGADSSYFPSPSLAHGGGIGSRSMGSSTFISPSTALTPSPGPPTSATATSTSLRAAISPAVSPPSRGGASGSGVRGALSSGGVPTPHGIPPLRVQGLSGSGLGQDGKAPTSSSSGSRSYDSTNSSFLAKHFPQRYFILKSLTQSDLDLSVRTGAWATQPHNEGVLDQAYRSSADVFLIFGVNKSGEFFGYARMSGPIHKNNASELRVSWSSRSAGEGGSRGSNPPPTISEDVKGEASERPNTFPTVSQSTKTKSGERLLFSPEENRWADHSPSPLVTPSDPRNAPLGSKPAAKTEPEQQASEQARPQLQHQQPAPRKQVGGASAPPELGKPHSKVTYSWEEADAGSLDPKTLAMLSTAVVRPGVVVGGSTSGPPGPSTMPAGDLVLDPLAPARNVRAGASGLSQLGAAAAAAGGAEALRSRSQPILSSVVSDQALPLPTPPADDKPKDEGWGTPFKIQWIRTDRLPFSRTRHLRNPWNHDREVKVSRDGTEIEPGVGQLLLQEWERKPAESDRDSTQPTTPMGPTTPAAGGSVGRQRGRGRGGGGGYFASRNSGQGHWTGGR